MAIIKVDMYTAECDGCGTHCEFGDFSCYGEKSLVREEASESGWHFVDYEKGKCYCDECWQYDDNDNVIFKSKV